MNQPLVISYTRSGVNAMCSKQANSSRRQYHGAPCAPRECAFDNQPVLAPATHKAVSLMARVTGMGPQQCPKLMRTQPTKLMDQLKSVQVVLQMLFMWAHIRYSVHGACSDTCFAKVAF